MAEEETEEEEEEEEEDFHREGLNLNRAPSPTMHAFVHVLFEIMNS
jgi:hypothetical protein